MVTTKRRRQVYTQEQRSDYLARFERSGMSQMTFCRRAKIHPATFSLWRRTARSGTAGGGGVPAFAEVQVSPPCPTSAVTLHLPGGAKLEVASGTDVMWQGLGLLLKHWHS